MTVTAADDDDAADGRATITHTASSADSGYNGIAITIASVTATEDDDDTAGVTVTPTELTVNEAGSATYTVALDTRPAGTVRVAVGKESGDDPSLTRSPTSLTFTVSNWSTPKTVTVRAADDVDSLNGAATFTHTATSSADSDYADIAIADVEATEADDDTPGVRVSRNALTVSEGRSATYTVKLNTLPTGSVTVAVAASGDSDGDLTAAPTSLTFTTTDWNRAQTVTVSAADDGDAEDGTATFANTPSGADYASATAAVVTATEDDDDTAGVTVSPRSLTVNENGSATYTVVLDTLPTAAVTVTPAVTGDGNIGVSGALTFTTANWNTAQTVTVSAADDDDPDHGTATIAHTASGASEYAGISIASVAATEADDDTPGLNVSTNTLTVSEGGSATYTVALNTLPPGNVTVTASRRTGDSDLTVSPARLTFTTDNWSTAQTATVSAAEDDDAADGDAIIRNRASGSGYSGLAAELTATEDDSDTAGVTVTPTELTVNEAGSATYTVVLDTRPAGTVRVAVGKESGDDPSLTRSPTSLTFTVSNWSTPKTVTVRAADDVDSLPGRATFTHTATSSADDDYDDIAIADVEATEADDDTPGVRVSRTTLTVSEGRSATYTVKLNTLPTGSVTVAVAASGDSDGDLTAAPTSLTFTTTDWNRAQTVTVSAADDGDAEDGTATFANTPSGADYASVTGAVVAATEDDDDTAGVTVTPARLTVNENGSATYTVVLDTLPTAAVTVTPAATGDVHIGVSGALTFTTGNWNTAQTVSVTAADDVDPDHGTATIDHTASGASEYAGISIASVAATEADDDTPGLNVSTNTLTVTEGGSATYTVALNTLPPGNVTVTVSRTGDSDLTVLPAKLTFTTDNWSTAQTATVSAAEDDDAADGDAIIRNRASGSGYSGLAAELTATEDDDDTAGVTVAPETLTVHENGSEKYTVVLDTRPAGTVRVSVGKTDGDDPSLTRSPASLTFTASNWSTPKTVTVRAADDVDSLPGRATFTHTATSSADDDYDDIAIADVEATEADDDTPGVRVSRTTLTVSEGRSATYTVKLNTLPTGSVTVAVTASGDSDLTAAPTSLTFTTTDWSRAQTVTVSAADDGDAEDGTATFANTPSGADYASATGAVVTATEDDDDTAGVTVTPPKLTVNETGSATYTVVLDTLPTAAVTVGVAASGDSDLSVSSAALTFTTSNWNTAQTVTVSAADDDDSDHGTATIAHAASGASEYVSISIASVAATEADDDTPGVKLSTTALTVNEGGSATYTVVLNTLPPGNVTVRLSRIGDSDLTVLPTRLIFTTDNWNTAQTATVSAAEDADAADGTATIRNSASGSGYSGLTAELTATEKDTAACKGSPAVSAYSGAGIVADCNTLLGLMDELRGTTSLNWSADTAMADWNGITVSGDRVAELDLGSSDLGSSIPSALGQLTGLTHLDLRNNQLSGSIPPELGRLTRLTHLLLDANDLTGSIPPELGRLTSLTQLDLRSNRLTGCIPVALSESGYSFNSQQGGVTLPVCTNVALVFSSADAISVAENATAVVTVAATDEDDADSIAGYAITGGADQALFGIDAGTGALTFTSAPNYEAPADADTDNAYLVEVTATSGTGAQELTAVQAITVTVTDVDGEAPSAPSAPAISNVTAGGFTASWTEPANPGPAITNYEVQYREGTSGTWTDAGHSGTDLSVAVTGLTAGTVYQVRVRATNAEGTSAWSATAVPGVTVSATTLSVPENSTATYTVALDAEPTAAVTVTPTATGDSDISVSGALTFTTGNWNAAQTATVSAADDDDAADGTATIAHSASGGGYASVSIADVTATEADDDTAGVVLSDSALSVNEESTATYTVKLNTEPAADVTVTPAATGDSDLGVSGALTFTTENWNAAQTVTVSAAADDDAAAGTATIAHTAASTDGDYAGIGIASVTATEDDDDTVGVTVAPEALSVTEESTAAYTVVLDTPPTGPVTVSVAKQAGGDDDLTVNPTALTFTTANWDTAQTVTVSAAADDDVAAGTATITHTAASTDGDYAGIAIASVTATEDDDDTAGVTVAPEALSVTEESTAAYTVVLDTLPTGPVTVSVAKQAGGDDDLTVNPTALTFTTANWDTAQTVTVSAADDGDSANGAATFTHSASGADYGSVVIADVTATESDNDTPGATVTPTALPVTEGSTAAYTVVLTTQPSAAVTVSASASGDADLAVSPSALTFTPSDWATARTVTVSAAQDDDAVDGTATIAHGASGGGYDGIAVASVTATEADDDTAGVTVTPTALAVDEGGSATYAVALDAQPTGSVTVVARASGDVDLAVSPSALTFTPLDWSTVRTVTVSAAQDDDAVDGTATIAHSASGGGYDGIAVASVAATEADDDTAGVSVTPPALAVDEGGSATYAVVLDAQPTGSVTVVARASGDGDLAVSPSALTFTPSDWSTARTVTVSAAQDDDAVDGTATIAHGASGGGYDGIVVASVTATEADDDTVGVTVTPTALTVNEGGSATYAVVLDAQPAGSVTVVARASGDVDLTVSPTALTFTPSDWSTARTVTVSAAADRDLEDGTATIAHGASGGGYDAVAVASLTATEADDGEPPVSGLAAEVGDGEATLTWDAPSTPVDKYQYRQAAAGGAGSAQALPAAWSGWMDGPGTATRYTVTGLANGVEYHFQVRAVRGGVFGAPSESVTATPSAAPSFGDAAVEAQSYVVGRAVSGVVLPEATGGRGTPAYTLSPAPPAGLSFDGSTRRLSGVPETAQAASEYRYRAVDEDGDAAELSFTIAVSDAAPGPGAALGSVTLELGGEARVSLAAAFGGTNLSYAASSSSGAVRAVVSGPELLLAAASVGEATVTVSASNGAGEASQSFAVRVERGEAVAAGLSALARGGLSSVETAIGSRLRGDGGSGPGRGGLRLRGRTLDAGGRAPGTGGGVELLLGVAEAMSGGAAPSGAARSFYDAARGAPAGGASVPGGMAGAAPGLVGAGSGGPAASTNGAAAGGGAMDGGGGYGSGGDWLQGTSFELPLGAGGSDPDGRGGWTLWGQGDVQSFDGAADGIGRDGAVRTGYVGLDARLGGGWLAGGAVSHSRGEADHGRSGSSGAARLRTRLTGFHPYARKRWAGGAEVWGVAGLGVGSARYRAGSPGLVDESDLSMAMGLLGARYALGRAGSLRLSLLGDAGLARLRADGDAAGPGALADLSVTAERLRLGLEGRFERALGAGSLGAFGQLSGRRDGGDGVTGTGLEVVGGLRYGSGRLAVEAGGRYLGAHSSGDWTERGYHLSLRLEPRADGTGLSLALAPSWGASSSARGARASWGAEALPSGVGGGLSGGGPGGLSGGPGGLGVLGGSGGLESSAGYGLRLSLSGEPLLTLRALHARQSAGAARTGLGFELGDWRHLGLEAGLSLERRLRAGSEAGADHSLLFDLKLDL